MYFVLHGSKTFVVSLFPKTKSQNHEFTELCHWISELKIYSAGRAHSPIQYTVPSRRGAIIYRPIPSKANVANVPSRRETRYLPSRPVVNNYIYSPVPSGKYIFTVQSCRDNQPVLSVPSSQEVLHCCPAPPPPQLVVFFFRTVRYSFCFSPNKSKYYTVPSRLDGYVPLKA